MAEIYVLDISECKEALLSLESSVSDKRRLALSRIKREDARLVSLASEILLAFSLKIPLPAPYKTDKNGKPYIPTLPFFNISHSGNFVVCAVSNKEVGVDIENKGRMKTSLARKILSDKEVFASQTVSGALLQTLLCEKWVRKEAYLKMLGIGLRRSMTDLTFDGDKLLEDEVFSRVYKLSPNYFICFCRSEEVPVSIINVSKEDLADYFNIEGTDND